MFSSDTHRGGFATIAIIGGTIVAVAVGGVFYFLRSQPLAVDTTLTEDSVAVLGDGSELSVDAERVLLRGLPRGRGTNYCSLLGLDRETCAAGVARACQDLFGSCRIDERDEVPDTQRQLAEACLVLGSPEGRDLYFAWLDSDDPNPFPLYYAIFGLSPDTFNQKELSDAYQVLLDSYLSTQTCGNSDVSRLLTEGFLVLSGSDGRAMYDVWLRDGSGNPFPLYYASLGVRRDAFTQEGVAVAYQRILDRYLSGYYGSNADILRLITEAYMVLRTPSSFSAYNGVLDGGLLADLSDTSFTFDGSELISALTDSNLSLNVIGGVLGSLGFSPANLADLLTTALTLSPGELGVLLSSLDLSAGDLGALIGNLNLSLPNLGALLGNLNLSPSDLGTLLGNINLAAGDFGLSAGDLSTLLGNLNLSPSDLGTLLGNINLAAGDFGLSAGDLSTLLGNLNLSPSDLGTLLGNINLAAGDFGLSAGDLSTLLGNLNLSPSDLGTLLGNINLAAGDFGLSAGDLSTLLGNLNLSPSDLGTLLGNLNLAAGDFGLSAGDLSTLLGNLNLSPSDLGTLLGNINLAAGDFGLSAGDLSTLLGNLNLSPPDINTLITALNIPPFDFTGPGGSGRPGGPSSFTGLADPSDSNPSLPAVTISAVLGQIGVLGNEEPSFRLRVTQDGSVYTPDTPISVVLDCSERVAGGQQTSSLLQSGTLPQSENLTLSTSATVIDSLRRISGVTGSVTCTVTSADTSVATVSSPSSATVTIVGGSSHASCDRPPCDSSADDLPSLSIVALESSIDSGAVAEFRISSTVALFNPLTVQYTCSAPESVADSREIGDTSITIDAGSAVDIRVQTNRGASGYVRCSLLDDVSKYTIRNDAASVAVGFARISDEERDPELPTVSLLAYQVDRGADDEVTFVKRVDSAIVGEEDVYFGFVVQDPNLFSFDVLDSDTVLDNVTLRGDSSNYELYSDEYTTISVTPDLDIHLVWYDDRSRRITDDEWSTIIGSGDNRTVVEKRERRITARRGDGISKTCGYERRTSGTVVCLEYRPAVAPESVQVAVSCYLDRPNEERVVFDVLVGGRYLDDGELREFVRGYTESVRDREDPDGELYQFIDPSSGEYISADQQGVVSLGTVPFIAPDTTFSCEIVGGGTEDGYNVGVRRVAVQVYPPPTVSIEPEGSVGVGDADPLGAPVATVTYGDRRYEISPGFSAGLSDRGLSPGSIDGTPSDIAGKFVTSFSVGFLTSFGSCVGANLLNKGISAISDKLDFGGGSVSTKNENLDTKECSLDSAASEAVMEVLTAITRDYIVWAHEGFEDKPLFLKNPTTFYKNFRDNVIGHAIDRSGLGFLCDIGLSGIPSFDLDVKIKLQQRYSLLETPRPRCTYTDLRNNLSEFREGISSAITALNESTYRDFERLIGLGFDIKFNPQYVGAVSLPSPSSDATNQLDALAANLDRTMKKVANSSNILLAISGVDDEVSEAEQSVDAVAKPGQQIFNPNDPTSLAGFQECSESENPESDPKCLILNVSGSRFSASYDKASDVQLDRLLQVDEFGEIGQLVKLAVNATSAGLMKRYLKDGFGVTVGRETVDILTDITNSTSSSSYGTLSSSYGTFNVGLGGMWWSAFFQDNGFYRDLLGADLYVEDVFNLLQYIYFSFHKGRFGDLPPTGPYNDFYTVHKHHTDVNKCPRYGPCYHGYSYLKDKSQSVLARHFNYHIRNTDDAIVNAGRESRGKDLLFKVQPGNQDTAGVFSHVKDPSPNKDVAKEHVEEALWRFKRAYSFLSNLDNRQRYDAFIDTLGVLGGVHSASNHSDSSISTTPSAVALYFYQKNGNWYRSFPSPNFISSVPVHVLPTLLNALQFTFFNIFEVEKRNNVKYPDDFNTLKRSLSAHIPQSHTDSSAMKTLRAIYEATMIVHIYLVGLVDEYDGDHLQRIDSPVHVYRSAILSDVDHSGAQERWQLVRDETLKKFRDGTLSVYIPLEDGEVGSEYESFLNRGGCSSDSEDVITVNHPTTKRSYQKTTCILGTVFQDQAYFVVRRNQTSPELLNESLNVNLICGYTDATYTFPCQNFDRQPPTYTHSSRTCDFIATLGSGNYLYEEGCDVNNYLAQVTGPLGVTRRALTGAVFSLSSDPENVPSTCTITLRDALPDEERYDFADIEGSLHSYPITLYPNQDAVLFPVPRTKPFFDSGDFAQRSLRSNAIRCSIDSVAYADGSNLVIDDGGKVTAFVEVSEYFSAQNTFHSQLSDFLGDRRIPTIRDRRIDEIGTALQYVYIWGWYTGFIEMPHYSIQGLLSNPPLSSIPDDFADFSSYSQELLQQYRLLASLFADENDGRFTTEHFGFLAPEEAHQKYRDSYSDRFDAYFGRALGGFLQQLPSQYRQQ